MRYQIRKDKLLRNTYKKYEEEYLLLKALQSNEFISNELSKKVSNRLEKFKVKKTRIINRCIITGRKHGILSDLKISRLVFKEMAQEGKIEGVRKSSW